MHLKPGYKTTALRVARALRGIVYNGPSSRLTGICSNVETSYYRYNGSRNYCEIEYVLREAFNDWPKHSGDICYPVPDPAGVFHPASVFNRAVDMWEGEYGKLRKELARHALKNLEVWLKEAP